LCGTGATLKACNATVAAGQNQPYWIDISVPHGVTNSPPGIYTGSISITADQGSATIPVTLTAWNFELPAQPSELSVWSLWPPATGNTVTTLAQALMRNKVMNCCEVPANASSDMTDFGLNRLALNLFYRVGLSAMVPIATSFNQRNQHGSGEFSGRHRVGPLRCGRIEWLHKGLPGPEDHRHQCPCGKS